MTAKALGSRAIIGEFYSALAAAPTGWADRIGFRVDSDQESETYKWLGQVPAMRQWLGGRQAKGLTTNGLTIVNLPFEATLEVLKDELRRDKTGQVMVRIRELAQSAALHWEELLSTLINNGATGVCYDGQYFFDTDHTEGNNTTNQSNKLNITVSSLPVTNKGSTTAPSAGTMREAILQGLQAMLGFKDNENRPLNTTAKTFQVQVPLSFWSSALAAVGLPQIDVGEGNILNALTTMEGLKIEVVANPRLTFTDKFAIFRTDAAVKPFILQEEVPIEMSAIAEGSEMEFSMRKHEYGVFASRNAGYGMWQHAVLVDLD